MASSYCTRSRRKKSLVRHQLRLEGLEKRYALNATPVLDPAASPQLNSVIEDAGIPIGQVGTLVSSLIDTGGTHNNFSDAAGNLPGIAITKVNLQGGTLHYSIDNGTSWSDVGSVSENSARVLYADSDTRLAFTPAANFHGSISDVFTFKAWNSTDGYTNGEGGVPYVLEASLKATFEHTIKTFSVTMSADRNTAYVSGWGEGYTPKLSIIDVSDPSDPQLTAEFLSNVPDTFYGHQAALSPDGNTAYFSGLDIINVSDPSNPILIGNFDPQIHPSQYYYAVALSPDGNVVYQGETNGVRIIDVSDPGNPTQAFHSRDMHDTSEGSLRDVWSITLSADGNTAYIAGKSGLSIVNVNQTFQILGQFLPGPEGRSVALSPDGNIAYFGHTSGLDVVDVSDPSNPTQLSSFGINTTDVKLSADGKIAYETGINGLQIIDVTNPSNPTQISSFTTPRWGMKLGLSTDEKTVYVANDSLGLQILELEGNFSDAFDTVSIEVNNINDAPTLSPITNLVLQEDSLTQFVRLLGVTAGVGETQPVRVTATSSNPSLIRNQYVTSLPEFDNETRLLGFSPVVDQYGIATITVTVEDGGLDLDFDTADDNLTFSQTFDVTITPDTDDSPSLVTPHGKMFIHQTLSGDPQASYQLPAVNVNGEAINGLLNRITVTSSDTALIPDPTVLYASADVPSSLSFTPVANANGTATLSIQVEDGGLDNDFATTVDNRQATHQVEVNVLEIISNQNSAILAKDSSDSLYVNTQPVIYNQQQVPEAIFGSSVVSADTSDSENALMLKPLGADPEDPPTHRLLTDETWRINGIFDSLQNASSPVLDLSGREVSVPLNIVAVAGAYEINGVNNPTLVVRRGQTYTFNLNTGIHRFWLQTTGSGYQPANVYSNGFTGNSQTTGEHYWVVPEDAPDEIFYQCEFHPVMFGKIIVVD